MEKSLSVYISCKNTGLHFWYCFQGFNVEFEEISILKAEVRQYEDQNRIDKKEKSDRERKIRELKSEIEERENALQDKESKLRIT